MAFNSGLIPISTLFLFKSRILKVLLLSLPSPIFHQEQSHPHLFKVAAAPPDIWHPQPCGAASSAEHRASSLAQIFERSQSSWYL